MELDQLLHLAPRPLNEEMFAQLLEHDRWKLETKLAHELELEKLRIASRKGNRQVAFSAESESDVEKLEEERKFNSVTTYGLGNDRHIGLVAKTKVFYGATEKANIVYAKWIEHIQDNNIVVLKDIKDGRAKTLLQHFLWVNGCAHRIARWPDAKDSNVIEGLKQELSSKFSKFSKRTIVAAYESLKVFWKEINDYEQTTFNVSIIGHILDEAYQYINTEIKVDYKNDIKNSPLFSEFEKIHPEVPLALLEKYYIKTRQNFVSAGVGALRRVFTESPPIELEEKFSKKEWMRVWHQHINAYEPRWQEELRQLLLSHKTEQEQWKKE